MLVECIKSQGVGKGAVLGVGLRAQTTEEASFLASLSDLGAVVTEGDAAASVLIAPASEREEEPEEKPAEEPTLETGHQIG